MSENRYAYRTIAGKKKRIHRHVIEEHLGRELQSHEHVYHLDGNSLNNELENLIIIHKKLKESNG